MPVDDPQEQFIQVDEEDNEIGPVTREQAHADNSILHRAVYILVRNGHQDLLFQKRSRQKDLYSGYWAVGAAGHVSYRDTYRKTAARELEEELGLTGQLFYVTTLMVKAEQESEMVKIFILRQDELPVNYSKDEVDEVRWVPMDAMQQFVDDHELPPADREVLKLLMYIK